MTADRRTAQHAPHRPAGSGHRRTRLALAAAVATALVAGFTATSAAGRPVAQRAPGPAAAASTVRADEAADGFASVDALGQDGTYGGRGGATVTVRTLADLEKYATAAQPYVIVVAAAITMDPKGKEIKVASDKTIIGSGTSGHIVGGGFFLGQGVHNVIIRNLTIRDSYAGTWNDKDHDWDAIQMDGAHHVWIDHNDLRNMADGLIDSRKDTTYLTVSWNRLQHDNKAFGIGWTENTTADITIHHNWFHETEQRNPSTDNVAHAHLYNNLLQDDPGTDITSSYGNYARGRTNMVLENSWFEGLNNPVTRDGTATLVQRGSVFSGTSGRNESGGGTSFDPHTFYPYALDSAADVPALVKAGAGPRATTAPPRRPPRHAHRRPGRQWSVPHRAGRSERGARRQHLPGRHRHRARHLPRTCQDPLDQEERHPPGHRPQPQEHRHRVRQRLRYPEARRIGDVRNERQRDRGRRGGRLPGPQPHHRQRLRRGRPPGPERTAGGRAAHRGRPGVPRLDHHRGRPGHAAARHRAKDRLGRVYMTDSYVVGNVDFVFGRASAVIDASVITLKKRWDGSSAGYITAPSTAAGRKGFLINDSTVNGDVSAATFYLGRPWHAGGDATLDPMTTVRDTTLSAAIRPAPWTDMSGFSWKDDRFAEYRNDGPGAGTAGSDRPQLGDGEAAGQEIADWLGGWTPSAS